MDAVNLSGRSELSDLVERAQAGEDITLLRDGKPVARIVPVPAVDEPNERPKVIDLKALRALRATMPMSDLSGVDILREMRDSRY
jgi:prevent-host-death family protein